MRRAGISFVGLGLFALVSVAACGGDDAGAGDDGAPTSGASSTGGGSGGAGGAGGGGDDSPTGPPKCEGGGDTSGPTPDARADTAGVLAPDGRTFLVFGGDVATVVCGATPKRTHVGDTWLLDAGCGSWTEVSGGAAPGARARHVMALDAERNRAILFGGRTRMGDTGAYTLFNDVWAFDFAAKSWAEITTTGTPPSKRSNAAAAVVGKELVIFGGNVSTDGLTFTPRADTFALDLETNAWRTITPTGTAPPATLLHSAAADSSAGLLYVYGGGDANAFVGPFFHDLWALDVAAGAWSKIGAAPPADNVGRIKLGLSVRPASSGASAGPVLYAFGGHDDGPLGNRNDVLSLDLAAPSAWTTPVVGDVYNHPATGQCNIPADFTVPDLGSPERRSAFAFAPRADGAAFVVFGGDSDCGRLNDAWWFNTVLGKWSPLRQTLVGLTCPRTGAQTWTSLCG